MNTFNFSYTTNTMMLQFHHRLILTISECPQFSSFMEGTDVFQAIQKKVTQGPFHVNPARMEDPQVMEM